MQLSKKVERAVIAVMMALLLGFLCPIFLSAQSDPQKAAPPPPPPSKPAAKPAPPPQAHPAPPPNHGTNPSNGKGSNSQLKKDEKSDPRTRTNPNIAKIEKRSDGGTSTHLRDGSVVERDKSGHLAGVRTAHGATAEIDARGQVKTIHDRDTTITHGPSGSLRIETTHADGSRVVTTGPGAGYVEHTFMGPSGRPYMRRTYVSGGQPVVRIYRGYSYNHVTYYQYVPSAYHPSNFYAWAYAPWLGAIAYGWGWTGQPWFGFAGNYFAPFVAYPSAAFWLTDYVISQDLQAAYDAQPQTPTGGSSFQAAPPNATAVAMSPETKQSLVVETNAEIAHEQAASQNGDNATVSPTKPEQSVFNPDLQIFIVAETLDVTAKGVPCTLSPGDVLTRIDDTPDGNNTLEVKVSSSLKGDCATGARSRIGIADLQEMHNRFLEQMDAGLDTLAASQGKSGIPSGPAGGQIANSNLKGLQTGLDSSATTDLKKQQVQADRTEQEVKQAASSAGSTGGNN